MKLHEYEDEFKNLILITAQYKHIPESAVEKDYYLVRALELLSNSKLAEHCVFKGGTSLSKCYAGSIERFSEDIDLTYIPEDGMSNKQIERKLKAVESQMTSGAATEIIPEERNERNKSIWFWYGNCDNKIKLEIGSSVKPDPYTKKGIKTYIQEYLEIQGFYDDVEKYELKEIILNVLNIERTFIDKIMAVKRHSYSQKINVKARHIYDVVRLFKTQQIQNFLKDKNALKKIVKITKDTDSIYLEKRNIPGYNPTGAYNFNDWKEDFFKAKNAYEDLHNNLLFTNEKQNFDDAIETFESIDDLLIQIGE